jgi:hypothetical protein
MTQKSDGREVEPGVLSFDSLDDMLLHIRTGEVEACATATEAQAAITYGDHFERLGAEQEYGFRIFGYIPTLAEMKAIEMGLGASYEEWRFEEAQLKDSYGRGWRYGTCFSIRVPRGEPGSTHIASMKKITKAEFEAARDRGWA